MLLPLAAPLAAQDSARRCGGDSASSLAGSLAGVVRSVEGDRGLAGTTVTAEWRAIALDPGNFRVVTQSAVAQVGADGGYLLCGLPVDAPLTFRVRAAGYHAIAGPVEVPVTGSARQDVRLVDSSSAHGPASLRGRVVHENGRPLTSGRVVIMALARDVAVQNGAFFLADLPPGTWVVEVRAIGLEPRSVWLEATERETGTATITMSDQTQQLDAVTVIGTPSRNTRILDDVLHRQRSSLGTAFLPGSPWLQGALHTADVLRAAHGFRYVNPTLVYGRPGPPSKLTPGGRCTAINVYVNGAILPGGLEELDHAVPVRDVLAVEAYADVAFAPPQWRGNLGQELNAKGISAQVCAVMLVWTSH
ncbi:MAG: carboxypeptidase regulatory-like domain-containing protein [Gemmatimonadales bacterium]